MRTFLIIFITSLSVSIFSQNTLGTITNNNPYEGYTLFSPNTSTETYLIDNCGRLIHSWTSSYLPGNSVYLLENGNLLRATKINNTDITFGGVGGRIELFDWDNTLLWEYTYSSSLYSQHHDIYPLPNGNILMLAVNTIPQTQAIQFGRNPSLILDGKIYNEQIIELEPIGTTGANIVWQWNIKDHLVQDYDSTKSNFGIVMDHPELLDFNFLNNNNGNANWLHFNSIQYNATLDQILMSSRLLSEIYIIDHSTTTLEASNHTGGTYEKGGDFLYRWGNPESYDHGDDTNKTLFSQHYPHWIPDGLTDSGKIILFNNGNSRRYSSVDIFNPPITTAGVYEYIEDIPYGPTSLDWTYEDSMDNENFYSSILSSGQRLPNGNTLICDGDSGYFLEIDPLDNIVWEYINPVTTSGILTQGDTPSSNLVFRANKYAPSYSAFIGKDLTPGTPIELNSNLNNCNNLTIENYITNTIKIYPNPASNLISISYNQPIDSVDIFSITGSLIFTMLNNNTIEVSSLDPGVYFLKIKSNHREITKKFIKS